MASPKKQSGVIPFRFKKDKIQILIVSTRSQLGWTIPKGNIEKGYSDSKSAAKEAFEEAGVKGNIIKPKVGFYLYNKNTQTYQVKVFLLEVTKELDQWPEQSFRKRKWISIKQARKKLHITQLYQLIETIESAQPFKNLTSKK